MRLDARAKALQQGVAEIPKSLGPCADSRMAFVLELPTQRFAALAAEHALDVWTKHAGPTRPVDVRVTQAQRAAVEAILDCVVLVPDVYDDRNVPCPLVQRHNCTH